MKSSREQRAPNAIVCYETVRSDAPSHEASRRTDVASTLARQPLRRGARLPSTALPDYTPHASYTYVYVG